MFVHVSATRGVSKWVKHALYPSQHWGLAIEATPQWPLSCVCVFVCLCVCVPWLCPCFACMSSKGVCLLLKAVCVSMHMHTAWPFFEGGGGILLISIFYMFWNPKDYLLVSLLTSFSIFKANNILILRCQLFRSYTTPPRSPSINWVSAKFESFFVFYSCKWKKFKVVHLKPPQSPE